MKYLKPNYIIIPLIVVLISTVAGMITDSGMRFYQLINVPSWSPSPSLIGFAWALIYILIIGSLLIIWNRFERDKRFKWIMAIFVLNGIFNFAWSWIFFGKNLILPATIDAGLIALTALILIIITWKRSKLVASLLIPYAGWTAFATYLTYTIYKLNPYI